MSQPPRPRPRLIVGAMIANIEPLTSARSLRGPFDYRIPERMDGVEVGSALVVPFGRRRVLGVVVAVATETDVPPERLVEPISALEEGTPADLVTLALWMAEEYCSTPARALALVLPPGSGTGRRGAPAATSRALLAATLTARGREAARRRHAPHSAAAAALEALREDRDGGGARPATLASTTRRSAGSPPAGSYRWNRCGTSADRGRPSSGAPSTRSPGGGRA